MYSYSRFACQLKPMKKDHSTAKAAIVIWLMSKNDHNERGPFSAMGGPGKPPCSNHHSTTVMIIPPKTATMHHVGT